MQTSNSTPYGYIYKITNPINGKCYIGQTTRNVQKRWKLYKNLQCVDQPKLYNALKKYGPENFIYEIFDDTSSNQEELNFLEESYILCLDSIDRGYNGKEGGSSGKLPLEVKHKISLALSGKQKSKEHIKNLSNSLMNQKKSYSHRIHLSLALTGQKQTEETILKRVEKIKGQKRTVLQKQKMSIIQKSLNKKWSEEDKRLMSLARKGTKTGSLNPMYGKHFSEEHKLKLSDAQKKRFEREKRNQTT
ncbi:MAG: NUMOD3 domain-containing DNA-binding protein [Eubacteriales bacterium]|nr:NUMOD3 domain-containing DNA-binding protein [Eubacteriales bacterium]